MIQKDRWYIIKADTNKQNLLLCLTKIVGYILKSDCQS